MLGRNFLKKGESLRQELGFTLLEVLIAISLLSLGVMAFNASETMAILNSRTGREISISAASAEEILERMRRNQANAISYNGFNTANGATRPAANGTRQRDYDQWKMAVEQVPGACGTLLVATGTPIPSTINATVTIVWPPCAAANSRRIVVSTVF